MPGLWWTAALVFTSIGALFVWGARAFAMDDFYLWACPMLLLAALCAALGAAAC